MQFYKFNATAGQNGGVISETSGIGENAFDERPNIEWISEGQNTDGDLASVGQVLDKLRVVSDIFVMKTNIADLAILYKEDGDPSYTTLQASQYTKITSADGLSFHYNLTVPLTLEELKFQGEDTTPADEEKEIGTVFCFNYIGEVLDAKGITPSNNRNQTRLKLMSGGSFIINKGSGYVFKYSTKVNSIQSDVDTLNSLLDEGDFYIWINGGYDDIFKVRQEPYLFENIYKVAIRGNNPALYYKGFFGLGISVNITFEEQGKR